MVGAPPRAAFFGGALHIIDEYSGAGTLLGASGVNSGGSGVNNGAAGVNSSASGVNSGASGVNSAASGVNSGASGVSSGGSSGNSGASGVNSGTSAASPDAVEERRGPSTSSAGRKVKGGLARDAPYAGLDAFDMLSSGVFQTTPPSTFFPTRTCWSDPFSFSILFPNVTLPARARAPLVPHRTHAYIYIYIYI